MSLIDSYNHLNIMGFREFGKICFDEEEQKIQITIDGEEFKNALTFAWDIIKTRDEIGLKDTVDIEEIHLDSLEIFDAVIP